MRNALADLIVEVLGRTAFYRLFLPYYAGIGSILCFHRIGQRTHADFAPNDNLFVTADFLCKLIALLRQRDFDIITISQLHKRLENRQTGRRFVCLTFDDGYRDNFDTLFPVCCAHDVPVTIYATTGFIDLEDTAWWIAAEFLIARSNAVEFQWNNKDFSLNCSTFAEKYHAFDVLCGLFRPLNRMQRGELCAKLSSAAGIDIHNLTKDVFMTRDMLRDLDKSGLVEIGSHTISHPQLAALSESEAKYEIEEGAMRLGDWLERPVRHFAFPFGQARDAALREFNIASELGMMTAVTTQNGNIVPQHSNRLTMLPRIDVSGRRQSVHAVTALMSGAVSALQHRFKSVVP